MVLDKIWPWSKFRSLEAQLDTQRTLVADYLTIIFELDPVYWTKKVIKLHTTSPRSNFTLHRIDTPE